MSPDESEGFQETQLLVNFEQETQLHTDFKQEIQPHTDFVHCNGVEVSSNKVIISSSGNTEVKYKYL